MNVEKLVHFRLPGAGKSIADFHIRMVWVASGVAWITIGAIVIAVMLHEVRPGETNHVVVLALLGVAACANLLAYAIPWRRVIPRFGWPAVFYVWSLALFAFSTLLVYLTPWLDSQLYLLYFPVILFSVATLDRRGQALMSALGIGSYAVVILVVQTLPSSELLLRVVALALIALLGGYITGGQRQLAVENAGLYEESRRAGEELRRVFSRFGRAMASSLDLDKTLHMVVDLATEMLRTDAAMLVLFDYQPEKSNIDAAAGERRVELRRLQDLIGDWLIPGIVRGRTAVQVADVALDSRFTSVPDDLRGALGSYLAVPLLLRGRVVGLLAVTRAVKGSYPAREVELVASFANQAAVAIENARLFSSLQERLRELSGLREISLAFASLTKLEDTYALLVERIAGLLDVERCVILLLDEDQRHLTAQAPAFGLSPEEVRTMRIPVDERSAAVRVWLSGRPYITNDAQSDPRNIHKWAKAFDDHSLVVVPMRVEGKTLGLIRASNKRGARFTNNDVRLLTIFATQAAIALRNAMLYREVAHQRARLEAIFDNASDGIMIVDHERSITAFNRAMETISGWTAKEVLGKSCREVCQTLYERNISLCDLGCPIRHGVDPKQLGPYVEGRIATKGGLYRDVGVSYSVLESPEGETYGVAIMRDISKAKELEHVKSQFISTVSHELRTPLASIKASTGLLLASIPETTPQPLVRLLHNIDRSGRRLESLVSDLLDLTRLQSGRVHLTARLLDLRDVINAAAATMRPLFAEKSQDLVLELPATPCRALGDRHRLEQILLNLLSNAQKYAPSNGRIVVTIGRLDQVVPGEAAKAGVPLAICANPPAGWCIAVQDNGPGVPPAEQEHIFERFYRVENQDTQRTVGTGLGLPIAKAIAELHGGQIWLASAAGQGSTFYVFMPEEGDYENLGD